MLRKRSICPADRQLALPIAPTYGADAAPFTPQADPVVESRHTSTIPPAPDTARVHYYDAQSWYDR